MAIAATSNFAELLWPGIQELYEHKYEMHPTVYTQFVEMKTSDKAVEKDQGVTGFPIAAIKEQGDEVAFSQMFQGFQKEYINFTYGIGAVITREMVEDDQYDFIAQIPEMLGESVRQLEETLSTNVLNNGFSSSFNKADGVPLFSASHPSIGQGPANQSNIPTVAADLTETSLEQACIDVGKLQNAQGLRLGLSINKLVVPMDLRFTAAKILETQYKTGSADNDKNIIATLDIKPIVTAFLTDTDAWFCKTTAKNGIKFYRRRKAELTRDNDFETDNLKIKTTTRFSVDVTDWKAWYASAGA